MVGCRTEDEEEDGEEFATPDSLPLVRFPSHCMSFGKGLRDEWERWGLVREG